MSGINQPRGYPDSDIGDGIGTGSRLGGGLVRYVEGDCPSATVWLTKIVDQEAAHRAAYNDLICGLVSAGIWPGLDALWCLKAAESSSALKNLVSTSYTLSAEGGAAFTPDVGYAGNGSTAYLETNFDPTTAVLPNFTQNDGFIAAWSNTSAQDDGGIMGQPLDAGSTYLIPRYTDDKVYSRICQSADNVTANTDGSGFFVVNRTGASAIRVERNGSLIASYTQASASPKVGTFSLLYGGDYFNGSVGLAAIGKISIANMGAFNTLVQAFMAAF